MSFGYFCKWSIIVVEQFYLYFFYILFRYCKQNKNTTKNLTFNFYPIRSFYLVFCFCIFKKSFVKHRNIFIPGVAIFYWISDPVIKYENCYSIDRNNCNVLKCIYFRTCGTTRTTHQVAATEVLIIVQHSCTTVQHILLLEHNKLWIA